jgi:mycothiol synthase
VAVRVEQLGDLDARQAEAVVSLRDGVAARDGSSPLSDQVLVGLRQPGPGARHLLAWQGQELVGYAHLDPDGDAELAVADGADAGPLLDELSQLAGSELSVWARGESSVLASELPRRGLVVTRELVQMRRDLAQPLDEPVWPAGVAVRTFVVGQDEPAWLETNNAAFAGHPDQSGWTLADVAAREHESWFDPAGFFLAERDGRLVGFHWTKVHPSRGPEGGQLGEIYVIGVAPEMQGQRLGAALALHGLRHLRDAGMPTAMLYVEGTNHGAISLYERLGFHRWDVDRLFTFR